MKRYISLFVIVTIVIQLLLPIEVMAAPTFTITPEIIHSEELPTTVVVGSDEASFTIGQCFPIVKDSEGDTININFDVVSTSEVRILLPSGLANGAYDITIGDSKGTYNPGLFYIGDATIVDDTGVLVSVAKDYNVQPSLTITGALVKWTEGETTIEVLDASQEVVDTPVMTSLTDGPAPNTKVIGFKVKTELPTGSYRFRFTTETEVLTTMSTLVVRGEPSIALSEVPDLSTGYAQKTLTVNGTNTGFTQGVTQVVLRDSDNAVVDKVANIVVANRTSLSFNLLEGLEHGNYTIEAQSGVERATTSFSIAEPSAVIKDINETASISALGIANDVTSIKIMGTNTHFSGADTQVSVLNSGNTDVTATAVSGSVVVTGQTCQFNFNRAMDAGSYSIKVTTNNEVVEVPIALVSPELTGFIPNTLMYGDDKLGEGYAQFESRVLFNNGNIGLGTTVVLERTNNNEDYSNKVVNIAVVDENELTFELASGLPTGDYVFTIDFDGDTGTTNDKFDDADLSTLGFQITNGSFDSVVPRTLINSMSDPVEIRITAADTHFLVDASPKVSILYNGVQEMLGNNVSVVSNSELTCKVTPTDFSQTGTYDIEVKVESGGNAETIIANDVLTVSNEGIRSIAPTLAYKDATSLTLTIIGENTNYESSSPIVQVNGVTKNKTIVSDTELEVTINPSSYNEGSLVVSVKESGRAVQTTSILIKPVRDITLGDNYEVKYDYVNETVFVDNDGTFDYQSLAQKPTIQLIGDITRTISDGDITIHNGTTMSFELPADLDKGTYTVRVTIDEGLSTERTMSDDFDIVTRYDSIEIRRNNSMITDLTLTESDNNVVLVAFGNENGEVSREITNKATWSVIEGANNVTVNKGVLSDLSTGTATLQVAFDGQSTTLNLVINEAVVNNGGGNTGGGTSGSGYTGNPKPTADLPEEPIVEGPTVEPVADVPVEVETAEGQQLIRALSGGTLINTGMSTEAINEAIDQLGASLGNMIEEGVTNYQEQSDIMSASAEAIIGILQDTGEGMDGQISMVASWIDGVAAPVAASPGGALNALEVQRQFDEVYKSIIEVAGAVTLTPTGSESVVNYEEVNNALLAMNTTAESLQTSSMAIEQFKRPQLSLGLQMAMGEDQKAMELTIGNDIATLLIERDCRLSVGTKGVDVVISPDRLGTSDLLIKVNTLEPGEGVISIVDVEVVQGGTPISAELSMPLPEGGQGPSKFVKLVHRKTSSDDWEDIPFTIYNGRLIANPVHYSEFAIMAYTSNLEDMDVHWSKQYVEQLASMGMVTGNEKNHFEPDKKITRQEFAVMLARAIHLPDATQSHFTDVAMDDWSFGGINSAYEAGIVKGDGSGNFNPTSNITRQDMVTMIARAYEYKYGYPLKGIITGYSDRAVTASYAAEALDGASYHGIIGGYEDNTFRPLQNASKAEAAKMILNLINM